MCAARERWRIRRFVRKNTCSYPTEYYQVRLTLTVRVKVSLKPSGVGRALSAVPVRHPGGQPSASLTASKPAIINACTL